MPPAGGGRQASPDRERAGDSPGKSEPGSPGQVAAVARDAGFEVEPSGSSLDVIVS
jgi:hypothetical protein